MLTRIIGTGVMQPYSREINLQQPIKVCELVKLLQIPPNLAEELLVVRGHRLLTDEEQVVSGDEIFLYLAVMGG
jgi:hypothetical protein